VREDHLDLFVRVICQQRVREQYPSRRSGADQRGVGTPGLCAESPFVDAQHRDARARRQQHQLFLQCRPLEWLEPVEQRQKDGRRDSRQQDHGRHETECRCRPPPLRQQVQRDVHNLGTAEGENGEQDRPFEMVDEPCAKRL
jgi:hypothetical protein